MFSFVTNRRKIKINISLYFQSFLKITPNQTRDKTHAKTKPNLAVPWATSAQSNLYFLQPKRIWAKISESAQFHFPFIQFLLFCNAYLRSFSAEISERKYFPFRFFLIFLSTKQTPQILHFGRSLILFFSVQFLSFIKTLISQFKFPKF